MVAQEGCSAEVMARRTARVAFVELDYHAEVLARAVEMFAQPGVEVSVFTRGSIAARAKALAGSSGTRWFLPGRREPAASFLLRHVEDLRAQDLIVVNTMASNLWLFAALPVGVPTYLRVHNVNATFAPRRSLHAPPTARLAWKGLSHCVRRELLRQDWLARRLVLRRLTGALFPTSSMLDAARTLGSVPPHLKCAVLPLAAYSSPSRPPEPLPVDHPVFCAPGAIDESRRDYAPVLEALEILAREGAEMTLCLLGRPVGAYGRGVVHRARRLQRGGTRVVTFDDFIDGDEFDRWIRTASALVAPTVREARFAIYRETYGRTKMSGTEADAVHAGKPCIFPAWYQPDRALEPASNYYRNGHELAREWARWLDPSYRARMTHAAQQACGRLQARDIISQFFADVGLDHTTES
jgi:glycosyltransferase involved in cell wall biosynthesis